MSPGSAICCLSLRCHTGRLGNLLAPQLASYNLINASLEFGLCLSVCPSVRLPVCHASVTRLLLFFYFFGTVYDHHVTLSLRASVYSRISLTLQTFRYLCTFVSQLWSCHADVTKFRLSRLSRCLYTVFRYLLFFDTVF